VTSQPQPEGKKKKKQQQQQHRNFLQPKRTCRPTYSRKPPQLDTTNRYETLRCHDNNPEPFMDFDKPEAPHLSCNSPTTQRTYNRRPIICCTENHLNNFKPVRPGRANYSQAVRAGGRALVMTDSMAQRINKREFHHNTKMHTTLKTFPGATTQLIRHYMLPHLIEDCPTTLLLHVGTNSLLDEGKTSTDITDEIVEAGLTAKQLGVKNVLISSIIIRRSGHLSWVEKRRKEVNLMLEQRCANNSFHFINNNNIFISDLDHDRVHLRHDSNGSAKFANNMVQAINSSTH
jgi:hypothetical protein